MKILITGATGYIGRRLIYELINEDTDLRILVRNRHKLERPILQACEITEGSTFDQEKLKEAVSGIHTAYYLIHSMGKGGDFEDMDKKSLCTLPGCMHRCRCEKDNLSGRTGGEATTSKHLKSRMETGSILSSKPDEIETVIFRAGVIVGSGSASFEIIRNICQKLPAMITPKWVTTKTEPIGVDDVIKYLKAAGRRSFRVHKGKEIIDIGSEVMSFEEMLLKSAEIMGLKRHIIKTPVLSPKFSAYWSWSSLR